jgi:hypothetical protein
MGRLADNRICVREDTRSSVSVGDDRRDMADGDTSASTACPLAWRCHLQGEARGSAPHPATRRDRTRTSGLAGWKQGSRAPSRRRAKAHASCLHTFAVDLTALTNGVAVDATRG